MGYYDVIQPCVVGNVQFRRPTEQYQPAEIDDEEAAPLVAEGLLSVYAPGGAEDQSGDDLGEKSEESSEAGDGDSGETAPESPPKRRPRNS